RPSYFMLVQFAEFLKNRGMYPMNINNISQEDLNNWQGSFILQKQLWEILDGLSKNEGEKLSDFFRMDKKEKPRKITFEISLNREDLYLGIYGNGKPVDWFGFEVAKIHSSPELNMMISMKFTEGRTEQWMAQKLESLSNESIIREAVRNKGYGLDHSQNIAWFNFREPVIPQYNGDAKKICEWFHSALADLFKLNLKDCEN
ncbi:MAG TPA: hypothetical protein VFM25_14950, partial [Verrucomicrobiae bacterium]|nr:hypothetical protein [Verrucomicrobiae bacterium]